MRKLSTIQKHVFAVASFAVIHSCAGNSNFDNLNASDQEKLYSGICDSLKFLGENGYLSSEQRVNSDEIQLELWDRIKYEKDGVLDLQRLLLERENEFTDRLHGAKVEEGEILVYFKFGQDYRCVSVNPDEQNVSLKEANCLTSNELVRVGEQDSRCDW